MPVRWNIDDLKGELTSMATLLERRGKTTQMSMALAKQFCSKLEAAASELCAAALLSLSDHLAETNLPEDCVDQITQTLDNVCVMDGSGQSALKLTTKAQTCDHLENFLTGKDWTALETEGLWPGVHVLVKRLRLIGITSLKECVKKISLGILVLMELQRSGGRMPKYIEIYNLGTHFSQAFNASSVVAPKGVRPLLNYPACPQMISQDFIDLAYSHDDPPVDKVLEDLNYLILNHIPVRSTSKLLKDEAETEQRAASGRHPVKSSKLKAPSVCSKEEQAAYHLHEAQKLMALNDVDEHPKSTDSDNFKVQRERAVLFRPPSFSKRLEQAALPVTAQLALPASAPVEFLAISLYVFLVEKESFKTNEFLTERFLSFTFMH